MRQTDFFFISHHHSVPVDIDVDVTSMVDNESLSSVVIRKAPSMLSLPISSVSLHPPLFPLIAESSILTFRDLASEVVISTEIKRYMHDLTVFLRMHRAIESGCVTARSAREFEVLVKLLAVIHGMDFVTPALVRLAVYKVFSHRLRVIGKGKAERERSVGYGSDVKSVGRYLEGVEEEMVVTDVVDSVKAPL